MRDLSAEALSPFPATWTLGNKAIPRARDCTVWLKMRLAWLVDFALHWRGIVILAVHLLAFTAIYPMSFLVRYEAQVTPSMWWLAILSLPLVWVVTGVGGAMRLSRMRSSWDSPRPWAPRLCSRSAFATRGLRFPGP